VIERLVRAQSDPYPNAFTFHRGNRVRVVRASVSQALYGEPPAIFIGKAQEWSCRRRDAALDVITAS